MEMPNPGQFLNFLLQDARIVVVPLAVFSGVLLSGIILRRFLLGRLQRWSRKGSIKTGAAVISSFSTPFLIWFFMLALYFALASSRLPDELVKIIDKVLLVGAGLSITFAVANVSSSLMNIYYGRFKSAFPVTSVIQNISRSIIYGLGLLFILNNLGVSITPVLATLGIGGLAVALGLQTTLANLFSGFSIALSGQIRVGDYIKLASGEEGYVSDINWRATKIKMLSNNVILVPNAKLVDSIVTNYHLFDREMAVLVEVGVHYKSDLKKVEAITCEVARQIQREVPGAVADFEPFIRYHTFADYSVDFTVILRVKEFVDQYLIKHEFIKRLHARYAESGIVIPCPVSAINYSQEGAGPQK